MGRRVVAMMRGGGGVGERAGLQVEQRAGAGIGGGVQLKRILRVYLEFGD